MPTAIAGAILGAGASTFAVNMLGFAISYVISNVFAPDEPDPQTSTQKSEGVQARVSSNPRNKLPIIYGNARVAGQTIFADISSNNQKMAFIVALSEGELESIDTVYWEDKKLSFSSLSTTPSSPTDAVDFDNKSHDFLNSTLKISVHPAGGRCTPMETFSSRWNSSAASRTMPDVAYAFVELTYDREKGVTGLASRLYFLCKGRNVDQLQANGTMSASSVMTTNPVDCLIDYLTNTRYGCSIPLSNIDTASMYTHKTFCDENKNYTSSYCSFPGTDTINGSSITDADYTNEIMCTQQATDQGNFGTWNLAGTTSAGKRYETNGVLSAQEDMDKNISHLTVGNGAAFSYNLGKFGLISEGVKTQATRSGVNVNFSEDNIIGRLTLSSAGFDEKLNELTVKFDSIQQRYQEEQVMLEIPSGSAIRNVNEPRLERTLKFEMVNNNVQAKRAGTVLLNQSRQNLRVSFETDLSNSDLQAGDVIGITHDTPGWTNKLFKIQQVTEKTVMLDGEQILGIMLMCKEYSAADYDDSVIQLTDEAPNTNFLDPFSIATLGLTATDSSTSDTGAVRNAIALSWTESAFQSRVEIRYSEGAGTSAWKYLTVSGDSTVLTDLKPVTSYELAIRMVSTVGTIGAFEDYDDGSGNSYFTTSTISAITPVKIEIVVDSGNGSGFTNTDSSDKTLKANVYEGAAEVLNSNSDHNSYNYRWYSNGETVCIDSSGNQVGLATAGIHDNQLSCESAGGYWESGGTVGTQCRVSLADNTTVLSDNSGDILGCTVVASSRADSDATNSTHNLRTIIVGDEDVTNSADIKCTVSNIP